MTFERFSNALRILRSVDLHELQAVGLFTDATFQMCAIKGHPGWLAWKSFCDDPYRFFLTCDEQVARQIWAVIEARQPRATNPVTSAIASGRAPTMEEVADVVGKGERS